MIKRPPVKAELANPWASLSSDQLPPYIPFAAPVDARGRYLPYDEFRHRVPKDLSVDIAWFFTKEARAHAKQSLFGQVDPKRKGTYITTNLMQKTATIVDQSTTSAALEWANKKVGEGLNIAYMLEDLIEDEAISSSQLEGAATTTLVAKEMIKRKREPRSMDERMIIGNFKMMHFVWDKRLLPLTADLIKELHAIGVGGIDDGKYTPGIFRLTDNVVVEDSDGNIVHQPPPATGLDERLQSLCNWVNTDHDDIESQSYIHSLVKAICIHFAIGYEHPFNDGNGRVARALFYWFMFKKDYGAFRYISISNLLKEAATQYGKSYLYTETDEMDMTYFIDYQCSVIMRAVAAFKNHCQKTVESIESFDTWLFNSGVYGKLSGKQRIVFQVAKSSPNTIFTARYVEEKLHCSYNTAATVLNGLVELNLFDKHKDGKEWIYSLRDKQEIQKNWIS
ncbi:Fic family protein [Cellvibrio sp. BR]|jgi:Fic family protein|uniref:Fic family protein n=1 Tax=Cellvibrio sp. BR TaxID=1134474 RepID=UPI0002600A8C|nr:Fic family protein [Cellvibrio sp. BR]EIK44247.1 Fic family protein [Cellvibrio sp. BR]